MQALKTLAAGMLLLLFLAGCANNRPVAKPDDPHYAPVQPSRMEPPPATRGSLYQANRTSLFGDRKAYRVGDVITVYLEEQTQSSNSNSSDLSQETNINITSPVVGGRSPLNLGANLGSNREFSGDASSDQSNSLQGAITATVHEVYPNGNLLVRGEKWLTLNQGSEYVRVSGIIRPEDIRPDNSISSVQMADARLTYSGTGDLAESTRQGWLTRFFNSGWWPL